MKSLRLLLLALGAVVVVGVAALIVASAALDPNKLRVTLVESVHRATGRDLTVTGPVHLRLGLSPRFEVDDIAFANVAGGSRPQMLTAKSLTAELALLPLLGGDAVISSLTLQDADIILERGQDGTGNWQVTPARRALFPTQGGTGRSGEGGGSHHVEIRTIQLDGGRLTWQAAQAAPLVLGITHLRWSSAGPDLPMSLAFEGTKNDVPLTLTASSGSLQRLQGGPVSALAGAWPLTVDAAALGATVHLEGGISHPDQARGFQFRLNATARSLAGLEKLVGVGSLPPLADVTATALLSDGPAGELRTSQVTAHAGASDLSAWVAGLAIKQLQFSAPGPGQLAQLNVDGTYQDQPLRLAGTAAQPDVVGTGGPIQATITGLAAGASLSAHGTVPPNLGASGLDMTVSVRAPDLAALSPLAGRALPAAHDLALDAQVGDAGVKLRGVAIRKLAVASSIGDATGELTVQWAPRGAITGSLTSNTLDLDAIAAPAGGVLPAVWPLPGTNGGAGEVVAMPSSQSTPATPSASPAAATPAQPALLPLARLRNTDADLALSVANLTVAGQHLQDLQAHLQVSDGKLALNPFRAQSPDGAIIGGISLDASSDDPPIAVTLRSPSISAAAVANLLGYPGGTTGTMQIDAQLSGVGQTLPALKASLDGHLGLAMVNGQVDDTLIQGLIGTALNTAGVPSFGGGTSQVRCLALRMDFTQGLGRIRALATDTSKLTLDGEGQINLQDQTADLHLRPRIRLGPTEVAAPVWLHGAFGQMTAALDPVLGGGRVGMSIGGAPAGPSACATKLALARGGLGGPMPLAAPPVDQGFVIRKPKDLLQGLFH